MPTLIKPFGAKKKYDIRVRIHDGRLVRFPGDRDPAVAKEIGLRIEMLVRAKANGDQPPKGLNDWTKNLPAKRAARLIRFDLLGERNVKQGQSLREHINDYSQIVSARKSNTLHHASVCKYRIQRLCDQMKVDSFDAITEDRILLSLPLLTISTGDPIAVKTRREYIIAFNDFGKWMVRSKRALLNPAEAIEPPGAKENPTRKRRPMSTDQCRILLNYLCDFDRYNRQWRNSHARDRRLIYWFMVKSAFRLSEMRRVRREDLQLDVKPYTVRIAANSSKNKTKACIPIPTDLGDELKAYTADLQPQDPVFSGPKSGGNWLKLFRKDLDGAGIQRTFPSGERIDLHALRHTAITWWLVEDKLPPRKVQFMARVNSLALLDNYTRYYNPEDFAFLDSGKSLVAAPSNAAGSGLQLLSA